MPAPGRADEADRFYRRSHELGHDPQPGLALLRAGAGRLDEALGSLRPTIVMAAAEGAGEAFDDGRGHNLELLPRLQRLSAIVELADRAGDRETLLAAAAEVDEVTMASTSEVAAAYRLATGGRAAVALGDPTRAVGLLRQAVAILLDLGLPYEAACARLQLARAATALGDELTASMEAESAEAALGRLGAASPVGPRPTRPPATVPPGGALSDREVEVLTLVSGGLTNREVAARLHLSEHTVARHLSNIFTKLGVSARTAAVSTALATGLLASGQD
ncbi:MAG: LuxR C-terminal-related transcriptional regulator [Ilumatobacteraceae bacterium]